MARRERKRNNKSEAMGPLTNETNVIVNHKFLFSSTTGAKTLIGVGDVMTTLGVMGTGVALVSSIFKAFRIKRIRIWSTPTTLGVATTNGVEWLSSDSGVMTKEYTASSNNPNHPAYLDVRPTNSVAAWFWRSITNIGGGANTDLFSIVAPIGSVIELTVSGIVSDVNFANWGVAPAAASVVGQVYYGGLDGIGAGTGLYPPIGLLTIV